MCVKAKIHLKVAGHQLSMSRVEDLCFRVRGGVLFIHLLCFGQICSLMRGGIAERGGVRVGHRIIEINGQSVVAMAHEKIVQTLSVSVGEVRPCRAAIFNDY